VNPAPSGQVLVEILALAPGIPRTELVAADAALPADAAAVLRQLFGERVGPALDSRPLREACVPVAGRIYAGSFGNTTLICGAELLELVDLGPIVAALGLGRLTFRLQIDSTIPSAALMIADADGDPVREVMLVEGDDPVFDEGPHLSFEAPFWRTRRGQDGVGPSRTNGGAPVLGPQYPDPVQYGLAALRELFGVALTEPVAPGDLPADAVVLAGYALAPDIGSADPFTADNAQLGVRQGDAMSGAGAGIRLGKMPAPGEPAEGADHRPPSRIDRPAHEDHSPASEAAPKRSSWLGRLWERLFPSG
jgi:hypothetical protein